MRLLIAFSLAVFALLLPEVGFSVDAAKTPDDKIVIIGGKKFFSLNNARHFNGKAKQPVVIKPNKTASKTTTTANKSTPQLPMTPPSAATASGVTKIPPVTPTSTTPGPDAHASDILSIFAPEDKAGPASPITTVSPTK